MSLTMLIIFGLVIFDQIFKLMASNIIKTSGTFEIIPNFFYFTYVENRGAAFGMLQNQRWFFIPITIIIIVGFFIFMSKYEIKSKWFYVSLVLIIAGGTGNLIDRIFLGYVVDFIYFTFFPPVFNFADCCVSVGACILPFVVLFSKDLFEKKQRIND